MAFDYDDNGAPVGSAGGFDYDEGGNPLTATKSAESGIFGTLGGGAAQTARSVGAFADLAQGDTPELQAAAAAQAARVKDPRLAAFEADLAQRRERLGKDPSWLDVIGEVGSAAWKNPAGAGLMTVDQLPNSAAVLAGGGAGALAGSALGPAGTAAGGIIGGIAGMYAGNMAVEGGSRALEHVGRAGDLSSEDRSRLLYEGAVKAGVITTVDAATLGLTKFITNATRRAVETATLRVAEQAGVSATEIAARRAADPAFDTAITSAQKLAAEGANTFGKRAMQTGAALGLETIGEGLGEYLGEFAATGEADKMDAVIEAFSSLGQSAAEVGIAKVWNSRTSTVADIDKAPTTEAAIATAEAALAAPVEALEPNVDDWKGFNDKLYVAPTGDVMSEDQLPAYDQYRQTTIPARNAPLVADATQEAQARLDTVQGEEGTTDLEARRPKTILKRAVDSIDDNELRAILANPETSAVTARAVHVELAARERAATPTAEGTGGTNELRTTMGGTTVTIPDAVPAKNNTVAEAVAILRTPVEQRVPADAIRLRNVAARIGPDAMAKIEQFVKGPFNLTRDERVATERLITSDARTAAAPAATPATLSQPTTQQQLADNEAGLFSQPRKSVFRNSQLRSETGPDIKGEKVTRNMRKALALVGRITGTKVIFEFAPEDSDGAVPNRTENTIHINTAARINPMQVMGHEVTHVLKDRHAAAWGKVRDTLVATMPDKREALDVFAADYWGGNEENLEKLAAARAMPDWSAALTPEQKSQFGTSENTIEDFLLDEMVSDLGGQHWSSEKFWTDVFAKIEAEEGARARSIIERLVVSIKEMLGKFLEVVRAQGQGDYGTVSAEQIEATRDAITTAYAKLIRAERRTEPDGGPHDTHHRIGTSDTHSRTGGTDSEPPEQQRGPAPAPTTGDFDDLEAAREAELARLTSRRPTSAAQKLKDIVSATPGLSKPASVLTLQEKTKVNSRNAARIVEIFKILPSEKEMAVVAYAGKAKRGWYRNSAKALEHLFGKEARRFAGLLAALSPQVSVEVNTRNALRMWGNWIDAGRPTDKPTIMRLLGRSVEGTGTEASVMGAWVNNAMDSLTIVDLDKLTLSGPKVNSFMRNLVGDWNEVTNDAWVANYTLLDQNLFSGTGKNAAGDEPGKGAGYLAMNAKTRLAAKELSKQTGVDWTPAEVQETIWSWAKAMLETLDATGETRTAKELLDQGVITDDLIAGVPDFEGLFRQEPYAGILRNIGLEPKLNTLPMPARTNPGIAPYATTDRKGLLENAARRIEFLQRQRRTSLQISWESKPGSSTGILPGIANAPLHIQQQYLADIFAELDMLGVGQMLGVDLRRTLFGPSAWQGDVAAGAQTILQKIGIIADNQGSVKVDAESRKKLEVAASILGLVLNQEGVYWHYPIYRAPDNNAMYPTGIEVNFGRSLTHAEMAEFYSKVSRLAGHQDWAPANTPTGVRFLNFTSFGPTPFSHKKFRSVILKASKSLRPWADGWTARDFTFDGDAIENNWKEFPNGEGYISRVGEAGRSDLLRWANDIVSPAIDRVNARYSDRYGWGAASRNERTAAETGATPDNFRYRSNGTGSTLAGSSTEEAPRRSERRDGAVSAVGIHYSQAKREHLVSSAFGTGLKGAELERVMQADDPRIKHRIYFYVNAGRSVRPELGVGAHAHRASLTGLYDMQADSRNLLVGRDENEFESAVIDAGYSGYISHDQGIAVLLGPRSVPVTYAGLNNNPDVPVAERAMPSQYRSQLARIAANKSLPSGQMAGEDWKRLVPALMKGLDVSHLNDNQMYYKSELVQKPEVDTARRSEIRNSLTPEQQVVYDNGVTRLRSAFERYRVGPYETWMSLDNGRARAAIEKIIDGIERRLVAAGVSTARENNGLKRSEQVLAAIEDDARQPDTTRRSESRPPSWYYSPLARAADAATMQKAPASGWKDWLKSLPAKGVKPDEIKWSGIEEWLDAQGKMQVTKEQVSAFLSEFGVKVETILRGERNPRNSEAVSQNVEDAEDENQPEFNFGNWETDEPDPQWIHERAADRLDEEMDSRIEQEYASNVRNIMGDLYETNNGTLAIEDFVDEVRHDMGGLFEPTEKEVNAEAHRRLAIAVVQEHWTEFADDPDITLDTGTEEEIETAMDRAFSVAMGDLEALEEEARRRARAELNEDEVLNDLVEQEERFYYDDYDSPQSREIEVYINGTTHTFYHRNSYGDQELYYDGNDIRLPRRADDADVQGAIREYLEENGMVKPSRLTGLKFVPTKWEGSSYNTDTSRAVPGSYREIQLTLPVGAFGQPATSMGYNVYDKDGELVLSSINEASAKKEADAIGGVVKPDNITTGREHSIDFYYTTHWQEGNVVGFARFDERIDPDGKRVLMLQEVQGDWGQQRRKVLDAQAALPAAEAAASDAVNRHDEAIDALEAVMPETGGWDADLWRLASLAGTMELNGLSSEQTAAIAELQDSYKLKEKLIKEMRQIEAAANRPLHSPAPFVDKTVQWAGLILKRILAHAVEYGFDKVAWTSGAQQVERWAGGLRQNVDKIEWNKTEEGIHLIASKRGTEVANTNYAETVLSDALGKTMADRIINDPNQSGEITGNDITISDTGMAGFYEKMLPNIANEMLKKLDKTVRVSEVAVHPVKPASEKFSIVWLDIPHAWAVKQNGSTIASAPTKEEAEALLKYHSDKLDAIETPRKIGTQLGFEITDNIRESAAAGIPLFSERRRASAERKADNRRAWYYSQLGAAVNDIPKKIRTGKEAAVWLQANASKLGIKKDELQWSGVLDYLQSQPTPAGVSDWLRDNGVKVKDVMIGEQSAEYRRLDDEFNAAEYKADMLRKALFINRIADQYRSMVPTEAQDFAQGDKYAEDNLFAIGFTEDQMPALLEYGTALNRKNELFKQRKAAMGERPKFESHSLPGGTNYRELLITLPLPDTSVRIEYNEEDDLYEILDRSGKLVTREYTKQDAEEYVSLANPSRKNKSIKFISNHFDAPNILAHLRFNERTDADGKRVLFIEEVQSDWAQKGRKEGFNVPEKLTVEPFNNGGWIVRGSRGQIITALAKGTKEEALREGEEALKHVTTLVKSTVPAAPFVTDTQAWTALALKRAIAYAVDNGFDRVAWTTGEQQAERYDLSKQVAAIEATKLKSGKYSLFVDGKNGDPLFTGDLSESELEDHVGKELAQKIVAGEGTLEYGESFDAENDVVVDYHKASGKWLTRKDGLAIGPDYATERDAVQAAARLNNTVRQTFTGLDLKVGGEGMKGFYDQIVPQIARKLGAKLGTVVLDRAANLAKPSEPFEQKQPGFDITDEMRQQARIGMPLFSTQRRTRPVDTESAAFKRWFGDSKVVDADGKPLVVYHGGPEDIAEFKREKLGSGPLGDNGTARWGFWFTSKKKEAQGYGNKVTKVYLSIQNPYSLSTKDWVRLNDYGARWDAEEFILKIKAAGHDGITVKHKGQLFAVAFRPEQIKSAISNTGKFSRTDPNIQRSEQRRPSPELEAWLGKSVVRTPMYHGTARDITTFRPQQADAIFLTDDPKFAGDFSDLSRGWMLRNYWTWMTPEQIAEAKRKARESLPPTGREREREMLRIDQSEGHSPYLTKQIELLMPSESNIMPLYVRAENPFDYRNPAHVAAIEAELGPSWLGQEFINGEMFEVAQHIGDLERGDWNAIESPQVQEYIRKNHDSFYVRERGVTNLAVFSPNQVKSASGNQGTYSRDDNDIRRSEARFKKWSGGISSKEVVRDASPFGGHTFKTGEPFVAVVHHGSPEEFYEFKNEKLGSNTGAGSATLGHFSAGNPATSASYTGNGSGFDSDTDLEDIISEDSDITWDDGSPQLAFRQKEPLWWDYRDTIEVRSEESWNKMQELLKTAPKDEPRYWSESDYKKVETYDFMDPSQKEIAYVSSDIPADVWKKMSPQDKALMVAWVNSVDAANDYNWEITGPDSMGGTPLDFDDESALAALNPENGIRAYVSIYTDGGPDGFEYSAQKEKDGTWAAQRFSSTIGAYKTKGEAEWALQQAFEHDLDMMYNDNNPQIMELYLRASNPFVHDYKSNPYREESYYKVISKAKKKGHDVVVLLNTFDGGGKDNIFVFFDPNQVKSATDNIGTYSPTDNDIRKSEQRGRVSNDEMKRINMAQRHGEGLSVVPEDMFKRDTNPGVDYSGVFQHAAEHIGDLIHRLSYREEQGGGVGYGIEAAINKASRFVKPDGLNDVLPQLDRNYEYYRDERGYKGSKEDFKRDFRAAATRYAEAYKDMPYATLPQFLAKRAAVNLGELNFPAVRANLRQLIDTLQGEQAEAHYWAPFVAGQSRESTPRSRITGQPINQTWTDPDVTDWDDLVRKMQDDKIDTKRVLRAIRDAGVAVKEKFDAYMLETNYHGRAAARVDAFADGELRKLLEDMAMRKLSMQDLDDYLWARHAPERNARNRRSNPQITDGSGMSDAQAVDILAGRAVTINGRTIQLSAAALRSAAAVAGRVDAITSGTLDLLVQYGLETQQTVDTWRRTYGSYVPLKRDMESDANYSGAFNLGNGTGSGFSVKGAASKRALGSKRTAIDILANVAMQRELAIARGEKNRVAQAVYGLALSAPNGEFWIPVNPELNKRLSPAALAKAVAELVALGVNPLDAQNLATEPVQRYTDPKTGLEMQRINPQLRGRDDVLSTRINGEDRYVFFSNRKRAQEMVRGLKNLDAASVSGALQVIAPVTRWFAAVNTQFNPVFGLTNGVRDFSTGMLNLSSTPLSADRGKIAAYAWDALKGIYLDLRDHRAGRAPRSQWAQLFEQFELDGGRTGYRDMFATSADRATAIAKELEHAGKGKQWVLGGEKHSAVFGWLSDYNTAVENAMRLAAYKAALDKGMSRDAAASLAKNLTVNFNKKGLAATQTGALYAFFNAAVQGTARIAETVSKDGKLTDVGKKIIYGGMMVGVMQALMGALAGWDDDEPPQFAREKNLIIPVPGTDKYASIPMPLGFHVLPNIGRITTEWMMSGFKDPGKRLVRLAGVVLDAFNPIGSGTFAQTLSPTIGDPIIALAENEDWTGKSIYKADFNKLHPTPGWTRTKDTASPPSKWLSYGINYITGGGKYEIGMASPTPDQIDYLVGQATGGVGRELLKTAQYVSSKVTGEELPIYKTPLGVGRFVGETKGQSSETSKFYRNLERIGEHKSALEEMKDARDSAALQAYLTAHPEARLVQMADRAQREIGYLRRQKRELIEKGANRERIKMMDEKITTLTKRYNEMLTSR